MGVGDRLLRPAVLLDRDGVLNGLVLDPRLGRPEGPLRPVDAELLPGAGEAVRALQTAGWIVVVVSNQPAAAKATVTLGALGAVHERIASALAAEGASPDAWRYCLHHPDGVVEGLSGPCLCRKPAPGMLLAAAIELGLDLSRSWMVGDADSDVTAGDRAGCRTIRVAHPGSAHRRSEAVTPDHDVADVAAAAQLILSCPVD